MPLWSASASGSAGDGPRLGHLTMGPAAASSPPTETPAVFLQTSGGAPQFIVPELLADIPGVDVVTVNFAEMLPQSDIMLRFCKEGGLPAAAPAATIAPASASASESAASAPASSSASSASSSSASGDRRCRTTTIHDYLNLRKFSIFMGLLAPSTAPVAGQNKPKHLVIDTFWGRKEVGVEDFARTVSHVRPDAFACIADDAPLGASRKRAERAMQRSVEWIDQCHAALEAGKPGKAGKTGKDGDEEDAPCCHMLGVVGGASFPQLRVRSAEETGKREHLAGFLINDLGRGGCCGGGGSSSGGNVGNGGGNGGGSGGGGGGGGGGGKTPSSSSWEDLLGATVGALPGSKVRILSGALGPMRVLEAVSMGIDVIDASYPALITKFGQASSYVWSGLLPGNSESDEGKEGTAGAAEAAGAAAESEEQKEENASLDLMKIDLRDRKYRVDTRPLVEGCECLACAKHTRAYLHHLLVVHEMLAEVLLQVRRDRRGWRREERSEACKGCCVQKYMCK